MLCPVCHKQNRDNAKFCKGCGLSFTPEMLAANQSANQAGQGTSDVPTAQAQPAPPLSANTETNQAVETSANNQPATSAARGYNESDDVSLAPTQILSPQQMVAIQARRWQQELDREQQEKHPGNDIAEAPTMLIPIQGDNEPSQQTPDATQQSSQDQISDVAEMPTTIIPPMRTDQQTDTPAQQANAEEKSSSTDEPASNVQETPSVAEINTGAGATPTLKEAQANGKESEESGATPSSNGTQPNAGPGLTSAQSADADVLQGGKKQAVQTPSETEAFPQLAPGTLVAGRYEVVQALDEETNLHVYQVIDHQGYQRCWNCGSQENTEGDEFCIDCGAELLNASYIMHEYPATSNPQEERVLTGTIINTFVDQGLTYIIEQPQASQIDFPEGVHLLAAGQSDAGNVRRSEPNEDSTLVLQLQRVHESISTPVGVYIVADGLGGHENGQVASRVTIDVIAERMVRELFIPPLQAEKNGEEVKNPDEDSLVALLQGSVEDANTLLCQQNQRDKTDMGSTITGFMIVGDHAYILNVGDSRTYMLRDNTLRQLTNDHSLVGQLVAGGLIEPDDVYTHPQRSQIFRSLGDKLNVQIDIFKQQVHPGDILLSCSDGLWEMIRNPQIEEILINTPDPQTTCSRLIETANANGGEDNVSAVVVHVR